MVHLPGLLRILLKKRSKFPVVLDHKLFNGAFQTLTRRELRHFLRLDLDFLTCLGVASRSGCPLDYLEGPEPDRGTILRAFSIWLG